MLTKNKIIEQIYLDKAYINICRQVCSSNLYSDYEDLFHEVIAILLQKKDQDIINAYEAKFIKFLFIRIANNQYKSNTSPFYLKYRGHLPCTPMQGNEDAPDNQPIDEEQFNRVHDLVNAKLATMKEYDRELFAVWVELGMSSAEVARRTGIEQQNISKKILKIRKIIADELGNDYTLIFNCQ